jgi:dCMP deaminase
MDKARLIQKTEVMVNVCKQFASLSHDPKHKVGAIVFSRDFENIPGIGYNGNYAGGPNERDSLLSGKSGYIHAEINAMFKMDIPKYTLDEYAMIVTLSPCDMCAKSIIQNKIKRVLILDQHDSVQNYPEYFSRTGVKYYVLGQDPSKWDASKIADVLGLKIENGGWKSFTKDLKSFFKNMWPIT